MFLNLILVFFFIIILIFFIKIAQKIGILSYRTQLWQEKNVIGLTTALESKFFKLPIIKNFKFSYGARRDNKKTELREATFHSYRPG